MQFKPFLKHFHVSSNATCWVVGSNSLLKHDTTMLGLGHKSHTKAFSTYNKINDTCNQFSDILEH